MSMEAQKSIAVFMLLLTAETGRMLSLASREEWESVCKVDVSVQGCRAAAKVL